MGRLIKEILQNILSRDELTEIISGFDITGDIAIIKIPDTLLSKKKMIAETLLRNIKNIKCVFRQASPITGEYRLMDLEYLAGEDRTFTIHKEQGCRLYVDISKVYFSPRLASEHLRFATLVRDHEVIINMFAGIGTFSIIAAKKCKTSLNYTIDVNPDAYELTLRNAFLNKVDDRVISYLSDAGRIIEEKLLGCGDRILMPYPERAIDYFPFAVKALKEKGGIIHLYLHVKSAPMEDIIKETVPKLEIPDYFKISSINGGIVREVGPRIEQIVLDIELAAVNQ
jgi:tRNA (guanine37-N1)-methyltransferase